MARQQRRVRASMRGRLGLALASALIVQLVAVGLPARAGSGVIRIVDGSDPNCTNTGVGSATEPYCTIQAAANAAQPGDTVVVNAGTYTENVTIKNSGTSDAPIAFRPATGANVTVSGQIHGFTVMGTTSSAVSWITITGFNITGTTDYGVYLKYSSHITLRGNHVTYSGQPVSGYSKQGIYVLGTTDSLIVGNTTDHNSDTGIYLTTGTTRVEVRGNVSFSNARQYTRAATGIDVRAAGNTVTGNLVHDNEDSGIQLYNGATGTVVTNNISYNNGDHGIDVLNSTNSIVVSNTAYENVTAGINFEGKSGTSGSSYATVRNNISVDNGVNSTTTKGNIRVDATSTYGSTLDYDLVYQHTSAVMMTWGTKTYTTLAAFTTASGQENQGFGTSDPQWVSPGSGDFHLQPGSVAIDSAASNAPSQPDADFDGKGRVDDPATQNIGVGPRTYDDRGALEYQPDKPPAAQLSLTPSSGVAPLAVTADASASTDADASPIATYSFDFGDGSATVGPQSDPITSHTYQTKGNYLVSVTVTDTAGLSATAAASVAVSASDNPPAAQLTVSPSSGAVPLDVTADASASTDGDATGIATYAFDFGDGSAATGAQAAATATHTFSATGTYTVTVTVTDTGGLSATATAKVVVGDAAVDEIHYSYLGSGSVAFDWRGGPSTISYGTSKTYETNVQASTPDPTPYSSAGPFWEATLTGLAPGTTYHYSIGGTPDATFTTPPTGSFRFDAEADVGDSVTYPDMGTTQGQIAADNPDFVLVPGDLTYGEAHGQQAVDQHFNDVMSWSKKAAYMPVWGNHDWETTTDDLRNYKGRFAIPNQSASPGAPSLGCCGEDWGWFDVGNVRFISYPEPYAGTTWSDWASKADPIMAAAQSNAAITYIVTYGHRPAYSTGNHQGETGIANALNALGDKYTKYVLNINGHSHDYERFSPLHGVVHITVGGGGATLESPWSTTDPRTAFRAMHLAHLRVDVTSTSLKVASICGPATSKDDMTCSKGSIIDSVTIPPPPATDAPPTVRLSLSPSSGAAPLNVTADASASSDGDSTPIASYAFDFGDGTTTAASATPTASHVYANPGTYTVTATVTDTAGRPSTGTAQVVVSQQTTDKPPTAALSVSPSTGSPPLNVVADASASVDSDSTPIASYLFDFGDGTSVVGPQTTATASHQYTSAGTFTVTMTVTDTAGLSGTATASVIVSSTDLPPAASLKVSPPSGPAPLAVSADASASTDTDATPISTYSFDFGDGSAAVTQSGALASHQYASAGSYTIAVTVTDTAGNASVARASVTVTSDSPPTASLSVSPTSGAAPLAVVADASASTDSDATPISSYRFDFGDGTIAGPQAAATASHTYSAAGIFTTTVTVTDTGGLSSQATAQVTVKTASGTNLIANPGFESGLSGWNNSGRAGVTLAQVTGGHSGSYAASLTNTTTSSVPDCTLNDSPNWVKTTEAATYTAGLWVRADTAGAKLNLRLREYNGSTFVAQKVATVTLSTSWQQVTLTYVPQYPGVSTLDYNAYVSTAVPGVCFYADDASITTS